MIEMIEKETAINAVKGSIYAQNHLRELPAVQVHEKNVGNKITYDWISDRIKKTIDQHFQESRYMSDKKWLKTQRLHYIGGILQTALHLLPTDKYYDLKQYCYEKYGYNPGGVYPGQININEWLKEDENG